MFALNEEELQGLSNEMQALQLKLKRIEEFTTKVRSRSKATNPIKTEDRGTFEKNLELILAIQNTPSFKETVIQYFLNNLFESNINLSHIIKAQQRSDISLYSKQERQIRLSTALLTDIVIQKVPEFPYSVAGLIISFVQIDHAIESCKASLKINPEVQALYSKTRQSRDFSDDLFSMFCRVDRKLFDRPISLNYGISLSAPHIHVHALKQFEHLLTTNHDGMDAVKFLDVGGGTGYVATLMAVGFVMHNTNESWFKSYGCIYNPILLEQAKAARETLNLTPFLEYRHATIEMSEIGWKEKGPFDGIYCGAAIKEEDAVLLREQLKIGGYLMCVVEHPDSIHNQKMKLVKRVGRKKCVRTGSKRRVSMIESESTLSTRCSGESLSIARSTTTRELSLSSDDEEEEEEEDGVDYKGDDEVSSPLHLQKVDVATMTKNHFSGNEDDDDYKAFGARADDNEVVELDEEEDEEVEDDNDSDDASIDLSYDEDFEETELFDVRFRALRTRFQYLMEDETDDSDEDSE